jgi:2-keto-3-deoxy-L-rhamnonate aldolase RhmA
MDRMNQAAIELKRRAKAGELLLGAWCSMAYPMSARIMARIGFDFVIIDTEHEPIGTETLPFMLEQFAQSTTVPFVRVAWNDMTRIKHAMDAGARGILVPMVNSVEAAKLAVSCCYYPPRGVRGFGPGRATDLYDHLEEYMSTIGKATTVWVQIEHIDAVDCADQIGSVDGVDALFIGPVDLSASMDLFLQLETSEVQQAIQQVIEIGRKIQKPVVLAVDDKPEVVLEKFPHGVQGITLGSDLLFLRWGAQRSLNMLRDSNKR